MESLSRCMDTEKVSIASCGSRMDVKEIRHEDKENKERFIYSIYLQQDSVIRKIRITHNYKGGQLFDNFG